MKEKSRKKKERVPLSPAAQRGKKIREERRKRKLRRFFLGFLIFLVVLAVVALILIFSFRLKTVNVTGNSRYTSEEILDILQFDDSYQNTLLFYFEKRNMDVESIPFIDAIYMDIGGMDTINVEVVEKIVIGCIEDNGSYIYIDTDGIVCEISDARQDDILLVEGLDYESPQLNQILTVADENVYDTLLTLALQTSKYSLSVDKVVFADDGSVSMEIGDITVMLGTSGNMEDKISEVNNLLPELESRELKGILHLENYDSTTDSIIFTKES